MDFGNILDKWEKGESRKSSASQPKNNALETWLNNNKVYDKDANADSLPAHDERHRRLRQVRPDDTLDIHGETRDEAWGSLDRFFERAKNNGYKKLRIIHGKGNHSKKEGVLGHLVREFIEKCPFAGDSGYEKASAGGSGATWVLLKTGKRQ